MSMNSDLATKKCIPCEGGVPPLTSEEISYYQSQLSIPWTVIQNKKNKT